MGTKFIKEFTYPFPKIITQNIFLTSIDGMEEYSDYEINNNYISCKFIGGVFTGRFWSSANKRKADIFIEFEQINLSETKVIITTSWKFLADPHKHLQIITNNLLDKVILYFKVFHEDTKKGLLCPMCGEILKPNTVFCPNCGCPISKICPFCNEKTPPGSKYCKECGKKLRN